MSYEVWDTEHNTIAATFTSLTGVVEYSAFLEQKYGKPFPIGADGA